MQDLMKLVRAGGTNGGGGIPDRVKGHSTNSFVSIFFGVLLTKDAFLLASYICKRFRRLFQSYLSFQRQNYCTEGYKLT